MKRNTTNRALTAALLFLVGGMLASESTQADEVKVFLLGGQSNMLGRASTSGLPLALQGSQSDVLFFGGSDGTAGTTLTTLQPDGKNAGEFGPEVVFGREIADAFPTTKFALIKYAAGGTALYNDWSPDISADPGKQPGAQYANFQQTVTNGLAALQAAGHTTEIVGMLWHQGESDAIEGQQANYQTNLTNFIADVRGEYRADLPFMIGEIRRGDAPRIVVADAQIAVADADPNTAFVQGADLSFFDNYHFDAAGMITLSERYADAYVANYSSFVPEPSSLALLGLGGLALLRRRRWDRKVSDTIIPE